MSSRQLILATLLASTSFAALAAPDLSGTPKACVTAAHYYAFQPEAVDPGKRVKFSIANKPSWASFDPATGRLYGKPTAQQVGTYSDIVITAYDDESKSELPPFDIVVQPMSSRSATLSWMPPMRKSDGSSFNDLAGYRIYYGTTSELGQMVTVSGAEATHYTVTGLSAASTYYYAMSSYDAAGQESPRSAIATFVTQ
ncbi:MAG TPA: fibronectin type III domain-containing protein [Steroidobacteraceae bacterium]|nr:fibronectin type III domain-containing protein [Steroidobacteraceae bacterium]